MDSAECLGAQGCRELAQPRFNLTCAEVAHLPGTQTGNDVPGARDAVLSNRRRRLPTESKLEPVLDSLSDGVSMPIGDDTVVLVDARQQRGAGCSTSFSTKIWNVARDAEGWRPYRSVTADDSSMHYNHVHVTVLGTKGTGPAQPTV